MKKHAQRQKMKLFYRKKLIKNMHKEGVSIDKIAYFLDLDTEVVKFLFCNF
ncbi:MAG: hypothetical protein HC817_05355 [Saprospiraceae bacterium]|nr:hypothetical protein [Saprospiraceae bacterium]